MDERATLADVEREWWRIERACHTIRPCVAGVLHQARPVGLDRLPNELRLTVDVWYEFDFDWLVDGVYREAVEQALEEVFGEPMVVVFHLANWVPLPTELVAVLDWLMRRSVRIVGRQESTPLMQAPWIVTADARRVVDRHGQLLLMWWDRMQQRQREEWDC